MAKKYDEDATSMNHLVAPSHLIDAATRWPNFTEVNFLVNLAKRFHLI